MRSNNLILILLLWIPSAKIVSAQNNNDGFTGLPGDNFSLQGALELFKTSDSPETFERMLNENNQVNNLDLNNDGQIDYIRVIDRNEGNTHSFILQDVINENESQDVAVIEVKSNANGQASLQIIGNENIYGQQNILEPVDQINAGAGEQPSNVVVNVWGWPLVRYIYMPNYQVWVSPWSWRVRPVWWHPWRPLPYRPFYHYPAPYRNRHIVVIQNNRPYLPVRSRTNVILRSRSYEAPMNHFQTAPMNNRGGRGQSRSIGGQRSRR